MRGLSGLTLALAGGLAGVYGFLPDSSDRQQVMERTTGALGLSRSAADSVGAAGAGPVVTDVKGRTFSPQTPLFVRSPSEGAAAKHPAPASDAANAAPQAAAPPDRTAEARAPAPAPAVTAPKPWTAAVTASPHFSPLPSRAGNADPRSELTVSLQKELKRVGCYDGEIHGWWNASSKRAMKAFTDRVNATLPIEEPDYILLTLVQGHGGAACGGTCPSDQILAGDGQCMPRAIVAQAAKKKAKRQTAKAATVKPADARVADVKPSTPSRQVGPAALPSDGWRATTIVSAAPAAAATTVTPADATTAQAAPGPAPAPLPGRMAVGAPIPGAAPAEPLQGTSSTRLSTAAIGQAADSPGPGTDRGSAYPADGVQGTSPPKLTPPGAAPGVASELDRPRPPRAKPRYSADYAPRPSATSKSSRVRAMHYNLFSRPDRAN